MVASSANHGSLVLIGPATNEISSASTKAVGNSLSLDLAGSHGDTSPNGPSCGKLFSDFLANTR